MTDSKPSLVEVSAQLTPDRLEKLQDLAARRGVDANTVLQQAIDTEKLLADNVCAGDQVTIKKPDNSTQSISFEKL